jgi:two-component system sensor histidine kinase MtrB
LVRGHKVTTSPLPMKPLAEEGKERQLGVREHAERSG